MKWEETISSRCRYGSIAGRIWGTWNILWENADCSYQGHAAFVARLGEEFVFYEWSYGSCAKCDTWEAAAFSKEAIEQEMRETALWFTKGEFRHYLEMLAAAPPKQNRGNTFRTVRTGKLQLSDRTQNKLLEAIPMLLQHTLS